MNSTNVDIEAEVSTDTPLLSPSSNRSGVANDADFYGNFPQEAIIVAAELWLAPVPSIKYYQLCWKLRKILVDNEVIREYLFNSDINFLVNGAMDNPNLFRPLFRGIAEGLSKKKEDSEYGLGRISDYELFHNMRNNNDYEHYSNMLEVDISIIRQRWVSLRAAIKQKQEHVLQIIMIRTTTWLNVLLFYVSIIVLLFFVFFVSTSVVYSDPRLPHGDPDELIIAFVTNYLIGFGILSYGINLYGSYSIFYERGNSHGFYKDVQYFTMRYILCILFFIALYFFFQYISNT